MPNTEWLEKEWREKVAFINEKKAEGLTITAIAKEAGISKTTIYKLLHRSERADRLKAEYHAKHGYAIRNESGRIIGIAKEVNASC